jgi:hypothetical protein
MVRSIQTSSDFLVDRSIALQRQHGEDRTGEHEDHPDRQRHGGSGRGDVLGSQKAIDEEAKFRDNEPKRADCER